jgi:hypothetical protein
VVGEEGPDHDKQFLVKVVIPGTRHSAHGRGTTKKLGEKDAAAHLLRTLGVLKKQESVRPQLPVLNSRLSQSELALWCRDRRKPDGYQSHRLRGEALRCVHCFRDRVGISLAPELATIALTHASLDALGPRDSGLAVLGNRAFNYALRSAILHEQSFSGLSNPDLDARVTDMVSTLGSNRYKSRLADPWSTFVCAGPNVPRPFPETVLLDAYEGLFGAAALSDLGNIEALESYLREQLGDVADFATISVRAELARELRNVGRSQLQQLYQFCFPGKSLSPEELFDVEIAGPGHAQQISCHIVGDRTGLLFGVASTRSAAVKVACDKALAWLCGHIAGEGVLSGVSWIDSTVLSLRAGLLDSPSEANWLAVRFDLLPFDRQAFWNAVSSAVRTPQKESLSAALHAVHDNSDLTLRQRECLFAFLAERLRDRIAARAIESVQVAFQGLLESDHGVAPPLAIRTACVALHLLKAFTWHKHSWVTTPDVVRDALAILSPCSSTRVKAPANAVFIEHEAYLTILHQLRAAECLSGDVTVSLDEQDQALVISSALHIEEWRNQRQLCLETWGLCDLSRCGFEVGVLDDRVNIRLPINTEVLVSRDGICSESVRSSPSEIAYATSAFTDFEGACTALHEIKNRIIAHPEQWQAEVRESATNLMRVAQVMRGPKPERTRLHNIRLLVEGAAANANAAYKTRGIIDIIDDDGVGYIDSEMLRTLLRNLTDNAARAASEANNGIWSLEGYIDSSAIEIIVCNSCDDVVKAKEGIEKGGMRSGNARGTGIGVSTMKRLAGKLLGSVGYEYENGSVVSKLSIPIDAATAVWVGGSAS